MVGDVAENRASVSRHLVPARELAGHPQLLVPVKPLCERGFRGTAGSASLGPC